MVPCSSARNQVLRRRDCQVRKEWSFSNLTNHSYCQVRRYHEVVSKSGLSLARFGAQRTRLRLYWITLFLAQWHFFYSLSAQPWATYLVLRQSTVPEMELISDHTVT